MTNRSTVPSGHVPRKRSGNSTPRLTERFSGTANQNAVERSPGINSGEKQGTERQAAEGAVVRDRRRDASEQRFSGYSGGVEDDNDEKFSQDADT